MADAILGTTINIEAQDTTFSRLGTTTQVVSHVPGAAVGLSEVWGSGTSTVTKPAFARSAVLGTDILTSILSTLPAYETLTYDLYDRQLALAIAAAKTGPTSVRGGTARVGFALADATTIAAFNRFKEVWSALTAWSQIQIEAVAQYNNIYRAYDQQTLVDNEQSVMASHAQAQSYVGWLGQVNATNQAKIQAYTACRHYGSTVMETQEDVGGQGTQDSAAKNAFGSGNWR